MTSSWTVGLLHQQLRRYAEVLRAAGRPAAAKQHDALAAAMKKDFTRCLVRDGIVAGYAEFSPERRAAVDCFSIPATGHRRFLSLIPLTQAIWAACSRRSRRGSAKLIAKHLLFPDGVHLMDAPLAYHGGPETISGAASRRRSSAARSG